MESETFGSNSLPLLLPLLHCVETFLISSIISCQIILIFKLQIHSRSFIFQVVILNERISRAHRRVALKAERRSEAKEHANEKFVKVNHDQI